MQVFVHISVFEGVVGCFLGGVDGGIEVLELGSEAHADFEGVCHCIEDVVGRDRSRCRVLCSKCSKKAGDLRGGSSNAG